MEWRSSHGSYLPRDNADGCHPSVISPVQSPGADLEQQTNNIDMLKKFIVIFLTRYIH